jgi:hypothetical protein
MALYNIVKFEVVTHQGAEKKGVSKIFDPSYLGPPGGWTPSLRISNMDFL